jgi:cytidylate kinase
LPLVAIDGPSGSGKSTVAKAVARRLGAAYLDTGAMYRAITWAVLQAGVDPGDQAAVTQVARGAQLELGIDPASPGISVDGVAVDVPIRGPEVTAAVSSVSAVPAVRDLLVARQRAVAELAVAEARSGRTGGWAGAVVEGRDIGTVVLPQAAVKVFLTADAAARARRRATELAAATRPATQQRPEEPPALPLSQLAATEAALARRDHLDSSRPVSPLAAAPDAIVLDSTERTVEEVVEVVLEACRQAGITVPDPPPPTDLARSAASGAGTEERP